jgi:hypothetical protein
MSPCLLPEGNEQVERSFTPDATVDEGYLSFLRQPHMEAIRCEEEYPGGARRLDTHGGHFRCLGGDAWRWRSITAEAHVRTDGRVTRHRVPLLGPPGQRPRSLHGRNHDQE